MALPGSGPGYFKSRMLRNSHIRVFLGNDKTRRGFGRDDRRGFLSPTIGRWFIFTSAY